MSFDAAAWGGRLGELAGAHEVPGASLAVLSDGRCASVAVGTLNRESGVAATPDSLFQIGSTTKPYTATVALRLAESGRLDLDAPIRAVVPDFRVADPETTESVTARHLLTHTSGIAGDVFADTGRGDDALARFAALGADLGQDVPLGTTMSYSNAGYAILGRVIECAAGLVWDDAMREYLFAPLGLTRTVTLPEHALRFRTAWGHVPGDDGGLVPAPSWGPPRGLGPAGWICASAEDVLRFAGLFLAGGVAPDGTRLLAPDTVAEMLRPQVAVPDRWTAADHWGLGWALHDWSGRRVFGHDGATPSGQCSYLKVVPDRGVAIALLTNGGDGDALAKAVYDELLWSLAEVTAAAAPQPAADGARAGAALAGRYERHGVRVEIEAYDGGLRGTSEVIEPLASQLPPQPVRRFSLRPSAAGPAVHVGQHEGDGAWWPLVFVDIDGARYLHVGARALRKVS